MMISSSVSFLLFLFIFFIAISSSSGSFIAGEFDRPYSNVYGSEQWDGICATGKSQSPINVNTSDMDTVHYSKLNFVNYDKKGKVEIDDNGLTIIVSGFHSWGKNSPSITGGGLKGTYDLLQFHLHWAQIGEKGSEHSIDGKHFPAEIHLLHIKRGYNHEEALHHPDGLAVVTLLLHIGNDSRALAPFEENFKTMLLPFFGNMEEKVEEYQPKTLLPAFSDSYYQYKGSLTTPGCHESVIFTILAQPVSMTSYQLELLRNIRRFDPAEVADNTRPVQPLNGRRVSFRPKTVPLKRTKKSKKAH